MALLDMLVKENIDVAAAHVNYHKRDTADRDMRCVQNYCLEKNIPFYVLEPHYTKGNFQSWARKARYEFFFDLADRLDARGVLIAHHKEDAIETYLLQMRRGGDSDVVGLKNKRIINGVMVLRPLLHMTKQQLIDYCEINGIEYHHDESNFTDDYMRNKIRHERIDRMSADEMDRIMEQIEALNEKKEAQNRRFASMMEGGAISLDIYRSLSEADRLSLLRRYLSQKAYRKEGYSHGLLKEWDYRFINEPGNVALECGSCRVVKDYDAISVKSKNEVSYRYILDKIEMFETSYFKLSNTGRTTEALTVRKEDFPLTIRSPQPGDFIRMRFGKKKLNRWFIDRKIPLAQRETWPVVQNSSGNIILIPQLGCDIEHYSENPSFFVIKCMVK